MKTMQIINSKIDFAGNCYWAFTFTNNSGKTICGTSSGGRNNLDNAARELAGGTWELRRKKIVINYTELPIRQFDSLTKGWPYAGCGAVDIAAWIKKQLRRRKC